MSVSADRRQARIAEDLQMCALPVGTVAGELLAGARPGPRARERVALPLLCLTLLPNLCFALRPGLAASLRRSCAGGP
ncbi:hypothetical protein [Streptomyces sp. RB17]|uniref:hypothetical protein n=1 Tax=Streptomyces sp. RB17 TaxID=2585197 RepID=UPI0018869572|nr:hypothetical protein [Streptomyces sp. RB17]